MKQLPPTALLLAALLGLSQCKKTEADPVDQLPPATQTGANTLGCLVNGQAWTPAGNSGPSNYAISYDPNPYGVFDLTSYRYPIPSGRNFQSIKIYLRDLHNKAYAA